jgi:hypothetical protein
MTRNCGKAMPLPAHDRIMRRSPRDRERAAPRAQTRKRLPTRGRRTTASAAKGLRADCSRARPVATPAVLTARARQTKD